jgi:structure-specific endonuclease subunit SLX1
MAFCYLLVTENGSNTYVGATVNLDRRLRQHNHELVGGARATGIQLAKGHTWKRVCYVEGIPDWRSALQIEWRWKQLGRTQFKHVKDPVQRRIAALHALLAMDRPTSAALPYCEYPGGPPRVCWEGDLPLYERASP